MRAITPGLRRVATALGLGVATACGRAARPATAPDPRVPTQVLPAARLYLLEMTGIPPDDSMVTFPVGQPRVIILRHGEPDNTVFAEVSFPDSVFGAAGSGDSVTVVLRPRPGVYGMDIAMTQLPRRGATIKFKYPVHFNAPRDAVERYGSTSRFEQALAVGMLADGTNYALLPSLRPASDNLESALPGPGTYMVSAPR